MSADEQPEPEVEETETAGESEGMSERTAKFLLLTALLLAMWGIIAAAPWVAYVVVGILLDRGWLKARGWQAQRRGDEPGEEGSDAEEAQAGAVETWRVPTFHELCESLARVGTPHAHIAVLAHDLGTTPERLREALDACGVQVEAVRMQGRGSSTGVKGGALPAPRPTPGGVVGAGQATNDNNDNAPPAGPEKGFRVEAIGQGGTVVHDPSDAIRHHQTKPAGR
jgi:hypothetical protein